MLDIAVFGFPAILPQAANVNYQISTDTVWLYAIAVDPLGPFKVGISQKPTIRVRELQTGNHLKLQVFCMMPLWDRAEACHFEASFHKIHSNKRIEGEWFSLSLIEVVSTFGAICGLYLKELRERA